MTQGNDLAHRMQRLDEWSLACQQSLQSYLHDRSSVEQMLRRGERGEGLRSAVSTLKKSEKLLGVLRRERDRARRAMEALLTSSSALSF
jgi:hypothetical protein